MLLVKQVKWDKLEKEDQEVLLVQQVLLVKQVKRDKLEKEDQEV